MNVLQLRLAIAVNETALRKAMVETDSKRVIELLNQRAALKDMLIARLLEERLAG